jgi:hypothetical protein
MKNQIVVTIYVTTESPVDEAVVTLKDWWGQTDFPAEFNPTDFAVEEVYQPSTTVPNLIAKRKL